MNHKHFDNWFSYICGVFGCGLSVTVLNIPDTVLSILVSMLWAGAGGAMGWVGNKLAAFVYKIGKRAYVKRKMKRWHRQKSDGAS